VGVRGKTPMNINGELCVAYGDSSQTFEGTEGDFNEIFYSLLRDISFMPPILPLFPYPVHVI
jgi:hypothetical protein